jgi:chemotaxis protein methyltransferase CheR
MNELNKILNFIKKKRGLDFYGYHVSMLNRRIEKRLFETNSETLTEYLEFLNNNTSELDKLISVLTINVSRFFRNTFGFEYLSDYILPNILQEKVTANDNTLRVWSAGSAAGEEAYSVAILINEIVKKEKLELSTTIIATDIDKNILGVAKKGVYSYESIKSIKYHLLKLFFN